MADGSHLSGGRVFCADVNPSRPWELATASLDRTVAIWDLRKTATHPASSGSARKTAKPLELLQHGLSVTSAVFSQTHNRLLTTCNDNLLRVFNFDGGKYALHSSVGHSNKTGRFLTAFQASWVQSSPDLFICGSLEHPRGVDVYQHDGSVACRLEDDNVASVTSINVFHPTEPVMAAANSSGRVYLWRPHSE